MSNQKLTRQQRYLIGAEEECLEVGQRISKALLFGIDEVQEGQPLNNRERLIYEFNDLCTMMELALGYPIGMLIDKDMMQLKREKFEKYLQYSKSLGLLEGE
jgi:hypothetical protein